MDAEEITLWKLFHRDRQYCVPLYQREYRWSKEDQWEPLWEDILLCARKFLEGAKADEMENGNRRHFLGAVVTERQVVTGDSVDKSTIIDDQQRLVTFQIVFSAFYDYLKALGGGSDIFERKLIDVKKRIVNDGSIDGPDEVYKVWPTNVDRAAFKSQISVASADMPYSAENGLANEENSNTSISKAYSYFYNQINVFCDESKDEDGYDVEKRINALYLSLRWSLVIVHIEVGKGDNAQIIFESLNARGSPLDQSDLIKNYIFMRVAMFENSGDELYHKWWKRFDDKEWKQKDTYGRAKYPRLDLFLFHLLQSQLYQEVSINDLYGMFRNWWSKMNFDDNIESALELIHDKSHVYTSFVNPDKDTIVGKFAHRLINLQSTTVYPVLFRILEDTIDLTADEELQDSLTHIESFLVRRYVCGLPQTGYKNLFLGLLRKLHSANGSVSNTVSQHLFAGTGINTQWPDDEQFRRGWLSTKIYEKRYSDRVAMILTAINEDLGTSKHESQEFKKLTVEHVLPVAWKENEWEWPMMENELWYRQNSIDGEGPEKVRDRLLNTFGNLTLVTSPLNAAMGNRSFGNKKMELQKHSNMRLSEHFRQMGENSKWNEEEILKRGEDMVKHAITIWPHPKQVKFFT